jgi:AraC family transcriptional regulator
MYNPPDILSLAYKQPIMHDQLQLLQEKEQQMPGSVQYAIKRYRKHSQWNIEDTGVLVYHMKKAVPQENYVELKFCVSGNMYCNQKEVECDQCKINTSHACAERVECIDVMSFRFSAVHLSQFVKPGKLKTITDEVLQFVHPSSFSKILPLCGRTRQVLEALLSHSYTDSIENIYINAQTQMLLLYSLECMLGDDKEIETFQCKFLANEADREKIVKAREILLQHIGEPITIKELSRKVAINECYLKKGFKELYGTTIFDFYQSQRMEHARYLLYEKGLTVTEVSMMLGYSSISHFSTAFKKQTGLKPCELLLH